MDPRQYRQEYTAELSRGETGRQARKAAPGAAPVRSLVEEMTNKRFGRERRIRAIDQASAHALQRPTIMRTLIALVADPRENDQVRKSALAAVAENAFRTTAFRRWTASFHEALRAAATDENPGLRMRALDMLALDGDEYAQRLLLEGLRHPRRALVPPARAMQMLGYDMHAEYYPLLRQIADSKRPSAMRRSAIRLLAADSEAKPLFQRIVTDKNEQKGARASSAVALQALDPEAFSAVARDLLLDDDDDDEVRATVLTALTHGPGTADEAVHRKVEALERQPPRSRHLRSAAQQFRRQAGAPRNG
jgi:hypothetical protein